MLGKIKRKISGGPPPIDHYELRFKPPTGRWRRATHATSDLGSIDDLDHRLDKDSVKNTAEAESWKEGEYALQGRRSDGTMTDFLWKFQHGEVEDAEPDETEKVEEAVDRALTRRMNGKGGGRSVEDVIADRIEDSLEAGDYREAAVLADEYRNLQKIQQHDTDLLDQINIDNGEVDLKTALMLHSSRSLFGGGDTPRQVGRSLAEMKRGYQEIEENVDDAMNAASGLWALAETEAESRDGDRTDSDRRQGDGDDRRREPDERREERQEPSTPNISRAEARMLAISPDMGDPERHQAAREQWPEVYDEHLDHDEQEADDDLDDEDESEPEQEPTDDIAEEDLDAVTV